ncbi:MAG TPA: pyrroline-5-carboxylate reductase [bacterium]|nr:pyrroline-5-carboxylate reductase [bacterium]
MNSCDPLNQSIAFLGAGNMGEAMLRGLARAGMPAQRLHAFDPRQDHLKALSADAGFTPHLLAAEAVAAADLVVLATKPQGFAELLPSLAPLLRPGQAVLSIAAGVTLGRLQSSLGPSVPLIRVMPNTPGLIGQGASAYCLGAQATPQHAALAEAVLAPLGLVLRVDEAQMDAVTALSGSGPAYVFLFMEALQAAGESLGLAPEAAFGLASQTLAGAAAMIRQKAKTPAELRVAVTSPGGTTAAALKVFEDGDFRGLVARALRAAGERSAELGKG